MITYFTLDNKENLSNIKSLKDIKIANNREFFINYSINSILSDIYSELYNKSFNVKGLNIEFFVSHDKEGVDDEIKITYIKHEDFKIYIGSPGSAYIQYPERELHFYTDDSSNTLYTYAGKDWEKDKNTFFNGSKCNSKLNSEDKIYLKYETNNHGQGNYIHTNDLSREYDPEGNEPTEISSSEEINKLKNFLLSLLDELKELPKTKFDRSIFDFEKTHLDKCLNLKCFYSTYEYDVKYLISGTRLISLGRKYTPLLFDREIYNSGFVYAEENINQKEPDTSKSYIGYSNIHEVELEILYSDNVYVLDLEPAEFLLKSFKGGSKFNVFNDNSKSEELTHEEKTEQFNNSLISKMIKIEDYDGSYNRPLYLINRIVREDEIKSIKKCSKK